MVCLYLRQYKCWILKGIALYRDISALLHPAVKLYIILRSLGTPQLCFYLPKLNQAIVPDEIYESYAGKKIYRKDPKFSEAHPDKL